MALFGSVNDFNFIKKLNKEVLEDVMEQQVGYYKISLPDSQPNIYGETVNKIYKDVVLLYCVVRHNEFDTTVDSKTANINRNLEVSFLRDHLIEANIYPERGDMIVYNDDYYELVSKNENQYFGGKLPDYNYGGTYLDNFGGSLSINCKFNYISQDNKTYSIIQ